MTRALTPRAGEQREREAGKGQGQHCPVPVTATALQGNSKARQHQDNSGDGVLGHGQPIPNHCCATQSSSERAPEPPFSQTRSSHVPCLGIRAQHIPAGPQLSSAQAEPQCGHGDGDTS